MPVSAGPGGEDDLAWHGLLPPAVTIDVDRGAVLPYRRVRTAASEDEDLMIRSTMQDYQLTIGAVMRHGARVYPGSECVTWTGSGTRRASYAEVAQNAARLAGALTRLGIGPNDPVATFAWNNTEHLEAYFGVPSMGAVLHTLNIRLPGAQVAQIVNHAGDRVVIVDDTLVPLLAKIAGELPTVEAFIVNGTGDASALGALKRQQASRCCATTSCWPPSRRSTPGPSSTSGTRR